MKNTILAQDVIIVHIVKFLQRDTLMVIGLSMRMLLVPKMVANIRFALFAMIQLIPQ